jgi:hypothetical protein
MSTTPKQVLRAYSSDYSALWALVPFVICVVMAGVSLLLVNFGSATEPVPAATTESSEAAPIAVEQHGA